MLSLRLDVYLLSGFYRVKMVTQRIGGRRQQKPVFGEGTLAAWIRAYAEVVPRDPSQRSCREVICQKEECSTGNLNNQGSTADDCFQIRSEGDGKELTQ